MVAFTPNRGYPYSEPTDPADVPAAIQALAEAVDDDITASLEPETRERPLTVVQALEPQTFTGDAFELIRYQVVLKDNTGMSNLTASPSTLTATQSGIYVVHSRISLDTSVTWNTVYTRILRNGVVMSEHRQKYRVSGQGFMNIATTAMIELNVGDEITTGFNSFPDQTLVGVRALTAFRMASL